MNRAVAIVGRTTVCIILQKSDYVKCWLHRPGDPGFDNFEREVMQADITRAYLRHIIESKIRLKVKNGLLQIHE